MHEAEFVRCLADSTAVSVVARDARAASELGVRGTPTLLVNDRLFTGSPGLAYLRRVVERAVKGSGE